MDEVQAAMSAGLVLAMALGGAVGWLVSGSRRERQRRRAVRDYMQERRGIRDEPVRPVHRFRGQGEAITVAELLEEAVEEGRGLRLNWPADDFDASPIQPDEQGQFPTVVLPRIGDDPA
jgi:hypothetical protein